MNVNEGFPRDSMCNFLGGHKARVTTQVSKQAEGELIDRQRQASRPY